MTNSILDFLRGAIVQYGYWAVGGALLLENAGIPVPGETILLLASFLAYSEHDLRLSGIIVVGTICATLGDNLGFALGYYGGRPLLGRYQSVFRIQKSTLERGERLFAIVRTSHRPEYPKTVLVFRLRANATEFSHSLQEFRTSIFGQKSRAF